MKTDQIESIIKKQYSKFDFLIVKDTPLCFKNDFSFHFVFLSKDITSLRNIWKQQHQDLVNFYMLFDGPKDLEWNFYALFFTNIGKSDKYLYEDLKLEIENDRSYSRKFLYSSFELDSIPPNSILQKDLPIIKPAIPNIISLWENELGKDFFNEVIINKGQVKDNLVKFLRKNRHE